MITVYKLCLSLYVYIYIHKYIYICIHKYPLCIIHNIYCYKSVQQSDYNQFIDYLCSPPLSKVHLSCYHHHHHRHHHRHQKTYSLC